MWRCGDARTRRRSGHLNGLKGFSPEVAFSPDGWCRTASNENGARQRTLVWDVRTGERTPVEFGAPTCSLNFSP